MQVAKSHYRVYIRMLAIQFIVSVYRKREIHEKENFYDEQRFLWDT